MFRGKDQWKKICILFTLLNSGAFLYDLFYCKAQALFCKGTHIKAIEQGQWGYHVLNNVSKIANSKGSKAKVWANKRNLFLVIITPYILQWFVDYLFQNVHVVYLYSYNLRITFNFFGLTTNYSQISLFTSAFAYKENFNNPIFI